MPLVSQRKRFFVTVVIALCRIRREVRTNSALPEAAPAAKATGATTGFRYPLPSFPGCCRLGTHAMTSREVGRVPPRRPKRRPHLGTSAIQRPSGGRFLLLLMFQGLASGQSSTEPILGCRADESADAVRHTTALTVAVSSSYESPVTEAFYLHRPARLYRGPRNWNTS